METKFDSLDGLDSAGAKEYILGLLSTLKMTEKEIEKLKEEEYKWDQRIKLAIQKREPGLEQEAVKEREKIGIRRTELEAEASGLLLTIEKLKTELRILPAKERSIDPDLLEQELLILAGRMPGDEKEAARDRAFEKLEQEATADAALDALKAKMGK